MLRKLMLLTFCSFLAANQSDFVSFSCLKALRSDSRNQSLNPVKDFAPQSFSNDLPIITDESQLEQFVGRVVALRGIVTNSKNATIAGVAIDSGDMRGKEAFAIGILGKFIDTGEADANRRKDALKSGGNVIGLDTAGPGVHYTLYKDLDYHKAKAHPIPKR